MKHKYYDKIVAKAANMELVVFTKSTMANKWEVTSFGDLVKNEDFDFFLCLPQHKEAVLNCLNGGESQVASISSGWLPANCGDPVEWGGEWWYMNPNSESRIKPKKEKRWIGVNVTTGKTTSAYTHDDEGNYAEDEVRLTNGNLSDWQFIEIEVEV